MTDEKVAGRLVGTESEMTITRGRPVDQEEVASILTYTEQDDGVLIIRDGVVEDMGDSKQNQDPNSEK